MTSTSTPDEMTVPADPTAPVQSPAPVGFVMRVHGGPHDGRLIHVNADKCTIGRARDCTVCLSSPEFEPLHCLIVRGRGGVVARCWSEGATKLNGHDFSVSWMAPGDRLGVGPIELELLQAAPNCQTTDLPACDVPPSGSEHSEPQETASASVPVADELAKSQQLLDQLLEERQDLLERLGALELELQETKEEREHLLAAIVELREELTTVAEQRREWQRDRDAMQLQLEAACERGEDLNVDAPPQLDDLDPPQNVEDIEEGRAVFHSGEDLDDDGDALDIKAVLARYGVVIKEDDGESIVAQDGSSAPKPAIYGASASAGGRQPSTASLTPTSEGAATPDPPKPAKKRSTPIPRVNLSALRDVANLTARVNIERAMRRKKLQQAGFKWSMGVSAVIIGWLVTVILPHDPVLAHVLSFTCWAMAVWWLFLGSIFYHKAVLSRPNAELREAAGEPNKP